MDNKNDQTIVRELLANERTLLAWIRTGIALMAFGFVVTKFSMFIRELGVELTGDPVVQKGYSSVIGIMVVIAGAILCILSFIQYRRNLMQIKQLRFRYNSGFTTALSVLIILMSILLIIYLYNAL